MLNKQLDQTNKRRVSSNRFTDDQIERVARKHYELSGNHDRGWVGTSIAARAIIIDRMRKALEVL